MPLCVPFCVVISGFYMRFFVSSVLNIGSENSESLCMSCKKLCMTTFSLAQEAVLCTGSGCLINSI